jgi:hypothetical protein
MARALKACLASALNRSRVAEVYNPLMPRRRHYLLPSTGETFTPAKLKKLPTDRQIEIMRYWFESRFAPPTDLPYDSGEGGIQWVGSGPYDAGDQLMQEFDEAVSDEAISKLASDLSDLHYEWAEKPDDSDYDEEEMSSWISSFDPFYALMKSLGDIEETAKRKRTIRDGKVLHRLLFANVITSLETYLGDALAKVLLSRPDLSIQFYKTSQRFREVDPKPAGTEPTEEHMKAKVESFLEWNLWHKMSRTGAVYEDALGITFPTDLGIIAPAIASRHDIVHRNGKSAAGVMGAWDVARILSLTAAVSALATEIQEKIAQLPPQPSLVGDESFIEI